MSRTAQVGTSGICDVCVVQRVNADPVTSPVFRGPRGLWQALAAALAGSDFGEDGERETAHLAYLARLGEGSPSAGTATAPRAAEVISLDDYRKVRRSA